MSINESFSAISEKYDRTREAVGVDIWLGALLGSGLSLPDIELLDAGCDTGNYALAMMPYIGHLTALDVSTDKLAYATRKLAPFINERKATLQRGTLTHLPFRAESFDVVMTNQALDQLDDGATGNFAAHRKYIAECMRVLKPGGYLLIGAPSRRQIRRGYWYSSLIPRARDVLKEQTIPTETLRTILTNNRFIVAERTALLDTILQGESYFDPKGPLSAEWRKGDRVWALASEQEIMEAAQQVRDMERESSLNSFMIKHDAARPYIGQITYWTIRKPE